MSADDISRSQGFWLYFVCVYAYMKRGLLIFELWLTDFTVTCRPIKNSLLRSAVKLLNRQKMGSEITYTPALLNPSEQPH